MKPCCLVLLSLCPVYMHFWRLFLSTPYPFSFSSPICIPLCMFWPLFFSIICCSLSFAWLHSISTCFYSFTFTYFLTFSCFLHCLLTQFLYHFSFSSFLFFVTWLFSLEIRRSLALFRSSSLAYKQRFVYIHKCSCWHHCPHFIYLRTLYSGYWAVSLNN